MKVVSKLLCLFIITYFNSFAQFEQVTNSSIEQTENADKSFLGVQYSNNAWLFTEHDKGILRKPKGQKIFNQNFKFQNGSDQNSYELHCLDENHEGLIIASNYYGTSLGYSMDGVNFTEVPLTGLSSKIAIYKDTLFSLFFQNNQSTTAQVIYSVDTGKTWNGVATVPFLYPSSNLNLSKGGAPVYEHFNISTLGAELYEVHGNGLVQIDMPFETFTTPLSVSKNNMYILHFASTKPDLYSYDRSTKVWTNLTSNFLPYSFKPESMTYANDGTLFTYGLRELAGIEEWVAYKYDGANWTQISVPEQDETGSLVCEDNECMFFSEGKRYVSYDFGNSWEPMRVYNSNILNVSANDAVTFFAKENKVFKYSSAGYEQLFEAEETWLESKKLLQDNGVLYYHTITRSGVNQIFASYDEGNNWEEIESPVEGDFRIISQMGEKLIAIKSFSNNYYMKSNKNEPWREIPDWSKLNQLQIITHSTGYYYLESSRRYLFRITETSTVYDFSIYSPTGYNIEILQVKKENEAMYAWVKYTLESTEEDTYRYLKYNSASDDWDMIFETDIPLNSITVPRDDGGIFRSKLEGRQFQLWQYKNGQLGEIYANFPPAAKFSGAFMTNDSLYITTLNYGLWKMNANNLGMVEPNAQHNNFSSLVYPNPSETGVVRFNWEQNSLKATVQVYSTLGALVFSKTIAKDADIEINLSKGMYVYRLDIDGDHSNGKLIIQ